MKLKMGDETSRQPRRVKQFVLIAALFVLQTNGLDYYKFGIGDDAIITFNQALAEPSSVISYEISSLNGDDPFCKDGELISEALQLSQRDRFQVIVMNGTADEFSATLQIRQIEQIDMDVYILSLQENSFEHRITHKLYVYVDVLLPLGKATCQPKPSAYSKSWWEVRCNAAVGSNGGGLLVCFQGGVEAPFQEPLEHSATHLTAAFWMNIDSPIRCCSHYRYQEMTESICTDFTFALDGKGSSTQLPTTGEIDYNREATSPLSFEAGSLARKERQWPEITHLSEADAPTSRSDATIKKVMGAGCVVISVLIAFIFIE